MWNDFNPHGQVWSAGGMRAHDLQTLGMIDKN